MVRNQTFTSSVSASVSAELTESLQQTLAAPRWRRLDGVVSLPEDWRSFTLLLVAVVVISAGMALHVLLAIETFEARQQISQLERRVQAIERGNAELVWQIAQHTSLAGVRTRALALGYDTPQERHYVLEEVSAAGEPAPPTGDVQATPAAQSWRDRWQFAWQTLLRGLQ